MERVTSSRLLSPLLLLALAGCTRVEPPAPDPADKPRPAPSTTQSTTRASPTPTTTTSMTGPLVLAQGVRFVKAGAGDDAASVIKAERDRAKADGRDLVVYVGATWCEPCQRFHEAAKRGELDGEFPTLTIMEFDVDVDRERLITANYESKLIPLFVMPGEDGRGSSKRFEGSVKGDKAVANIAPRLRGLLTK